MDINTDVKFATFDEKTDATLLQWLDLNHFYPIFPFQSRINYRGCLKGIDLNLTENFLNEIEKNREDNHYCQIAGLEYKRYVCECFVKDYGKFISFEIDIPHIYLNPRSGIRMSITPLHFEMRIINTPLTGYKLDLMYLDMAYIQFLNEVERRLKEFVLKIAHNCSVLEEKAFEYAKMKDELEKCGFIDDTPLFIIPNSDYVTTLSKNLKLDDDFELSMTLKLYSSIISDVDNDDFEALLTFNLYRVRPHSLLFMWPSSRRYYEDCEDYKYIISPIKKLIKILDMTFANKFFNKAKEAINFIKSTNELIESIIHNEDDVIEWKGYI